MPASRVPEVWLRGPLPEYAPVLMPVAHALLQAREDVERVARDATAEALWQRPGGAASAGYHLQHLGGSLERLLTYARGESLAEAQRVALAREGTPGAPASVLVPEVLAQIDRALDQIRRTPAGSLGEARPVGRAGLPSTVLGLLFHAAEHTSRHVGQLITTLKIVRGGGSGTETVSGIGGVFFRARDPELLGRWYLEHLGVPLAPGTYEQEPWRQEAGPTVFAPFPETTDYFGSPRQVWMINFRVRDLAAVIAELTAAGIEVVADPTEYPNGRFARLKDPEGNPIELWEPRPPTDTMQGTPDAPRRA